MAVFLVSCSQGDDGQKQDAPAYAVMTLDTLTAFAYDEYSTIIQSNTVVEIRPNVSGYLESIQKNEGESVVKGELLFQIRDAEFRQNVNAADAAVQSARANEAKTALEVSKLEPLVAKGITSNFELQTARINHDAAVAALGQAQANYENALVTLGYTTITSPVDGVLGRIYVREGSLVSPSQADALTTVSSYGDVSAYFSLDEKKFDMVRRMVSEGSEHNLKKNVIELVMADGSMYRHKGRLELASGIIDRNTGSVQMKAIFPNPDNELFSGSSGLIRIPVSYSGCLVVPQSATYEMQDKTMVYVVNADSTVTRRVAKVEALAIEGYVVSNLPAGTMIVTEGVDKLKDGVRIEPRQREEVQ